MGKPTVRWISRRPFTTQWSSNSGGTYTFGATAYDKAGNATSATPVSVTYIP
jgi:hypothetical protein